MTLFETMRDNPDAGFDSAVALHGATNELAQARQAIDEYRADLAAANARAEQLAEALRSIQQGFIDGDIKFTKKRVSDGDPYHKANYLMTAALADYKAVTP